MEIGKFRKFALTSVIFSLGASAIIKLMYPIDTLSIIKLAVFLALTFLIFGVAFSILAQVIKKYTKNLK